MKNNNSNNEIDYLISREIYANKSVRLSETALQLLADNGISNLSRFLDELITESLSDKNFWKKKLIAELNKIQERLKKVGCEVEIDIKNQ